MKRIAVFTSGGDAPGMNACIRAVVRTAAHMNVEVFGIMRGYQGMIEGEFKKMDSRSVANILQRGGTILKTARSSEFMTLEGRKKAFEQLKKHDIEGLICIGGNGTYTGAMVFHEEFGLPAVGLPGTIDNDLYGTDYTIGYDTAVNTALEAIDRIRDTADSHNRVFIVEVMGRDSGFIAMDVGIACGAEAILVPEDKQDVAKLYRFFDKGKRRIKSFSIVVVAEGDEEGGALEMSKKLSARYPDLNIRTTILGHIQRGGSPSVRDRVLASRLGSKAVESLLQGEKNCTIGIVNDEICFTPFSEAIHKHKQIHHNLISLAEVLA